MRRELLSVQHVLALLVATALLWTLREYSALLVDRLPVFASPLEATRLQHVTANHATNFAFGLMVAFLISMAQELGKSRSVGQAFGVGLLMGAIGLVAHSAGATPETARAADARAMIMLMGYIAASLLLFAGKQFARRQMTENGPDTTADSF